MTAVLTGCGDDAQSTDTTAPSSSTTSSIPAEPEPTTTTMAELSGPALQGAAGVVGLDAVSIDGPGSEPDKIRFKDDGTYEVVDQFRTVDTGVYTTEGDVITFESEPGKLVQWIYEAEPFLQPCDDIVGRYTVVYETSTRLQLNVISDKCSRRLTGANRLTLDLQVDG